MKHLGLGTNKPKKRKIPYNGTGFYNEIASSCIHQNAPHVKPHQGRVPSKIRPVNDDLMGPIFPVDRMGMKRYFGHTRLPISLSSSFAAFFPNADGGE